jgi:hypothetical protein
MHSKRQKAADALDVQRERERERERSFSFLGPLTGGGADAHALSTHAYDGLCRDVRIDVEHAIRGVVAFCRKSRRETVRFGVRCEASAARQEVH